MMTCIDGYAMTQRGRAGAGTRDRRDRLVCRRHAGVVGLMLLAPTLASFALRFGPPEYTALLLMGFFMLAYMSGGSMLKTLAMAALGLLLGMIGIDAMSGYTRFSLRYHRTRRRHRHRAGRGRPLRHLRNPAHRGPADAPRFNGRSCGELMPSREELRDRSGRSGAAAVLGFLIGIIPGSAHIISSFVSYGIERRISKHPERFGNGAIEGVAGPESANNSAATGAFVPMLALGIPTGPITAVMIAAIMVHGISPGPMLITAAARAVLGLCREHVRRQRRAADPEPAAGRALREPAAHPVRVSLSGHPVLLHPRLLFGLNSVVDVWIMLVMGGSAIVLRKFGFDLAPVALGLVLAPMLELSLRQSLAMSAGDYAIFLQRPIASTMLVLGLVLLLLGAEAALQPQGRWRASGAGEELET